jgi:hypothetical protein
MVWQRGRRRTRTQNARIIDQARSLYIASASCRRDAFARVHLEMYCEQKSFSGYEKDEDDKGTVPLLVHAVPMWILSRPVLDGLNNKVVLLPPALSSMGAVPARRAAGIRVREHCSGWAAALPHENRWLLKAGSQRNASIDVVI